MGKANHERAGAPGELRRGLMLYGSTAALAAALMLAEGGIGPAWAQDIGPRISPTEAAQGSFLAPGPTPAPYFEFRSAELDIVRINRDSAILNWTTYDADAPGGAQGNSFVNFLPEGAELRFTGNGQDYTVINRVFTQPDNGGNYRGLAFQGAVTSYLSGSGSGSGPGSVGPVGGNVWFYSPGGIFATGTASFNVGSLVLSASDFDNFTDVGQARFVDLVGVTDPFAAVVLQQGARVTLTQPNSSFAVVAPTIVQGGEVSVDGSTLYMSAETGQLYFYDNGEVAGAIYQEARAGNEIRHLGTTAGPASLGTDDFSIFDPQTIEFRTGADVGVLLSGTLGYAPATDAALGPNGTILLLAPGGVSAGGSITLTSSTVIESTQVDLTLGAGESLTMGGDANGAYALDVITPSGVLAADVGGAIDIAGNVSFRPDTGTGSFRVTAAAAQGNLAGGQIAIGGDLLIDSSPNNFRGSSREGGEIEVQIGNGGGLAVGGAMTLLSDGFASEDANSVTSAQGGRATVALTGPEASLSVGGALTISAQARPFAFNCECSPPPSGSAIGGYAALTATGGTIQLDTLAVSAGAEASGGNFSFDGADLGGTGGSALVDLGDSVATIAYASINADAVGAAGETGVAGDAALGGTASFSKGGGGSLSLGGLYVAAEARGGNGSGSFESGDPGRGGAAQGGTASVSFGQTPTGLGYLEISADATGGTGGSGVNGNGVSGAAGGDATGGTISLTLTGEDTILAGLSEGQLTVVSAGGAGGAGDADFNRGVQSGAGGAGGAGRAGLITITAAGGAEYRSELALAVSGNGGEGGSGGAAVIGESGSSEPGAGGQGGDGFGGEVELIADGGTISGSLAVEAFGNGGRGGRNGSIGENFPGEGAFGAFVGGAITLAATDNGASRFDVDSASLRTGGDTTGTISIRDDTTAPGAGMRFGSLLAQASGTPIEAAPTIRVSSAANPILIDGTAEFYGHSIGMSLAGSGGIDVGGFTLLSAYAGDITISHVGNEFNLSLQSGGPIEVFANGNIIAGPGSVIASADHADLRASGSVTAADVRALSFLSVAAQGDVALGNASAGSNFDLYAGRLDLDGSFAYVPSATATITGTVAVGGSALIESGGFAVFASGSQVLADNAITVRTGDDIIVASGASLVSDLNPVGQDTIRLLAGDINFGQNRGDLIAPIGTPIASLIVGGSLDSNGQSIFLSADAIQGLGGTITTGNLAVDVTDAPPFGPYSNDAGLLSNACRQGSACLGSVAATGDVAIGLDSNGGMVSLRIGQVQFTGGAFDALARDLIAIGTGESASLLAGSTRVSLESTAASVSLTEVTVDSTQIAIRAATSIDAASSVLQSANDILLQVGSDITVGTITTGGRLDDGTGSSLFAVPGNLDVGSLSYDGSADMLIQAGGAIVVGRAEARGGIALDGTSITLDNAGSGGALSLTARDGAISGGGFYEAGGIVDLQAAQGIAIGSVDALGDISMTAGAEARFVEIRSQGGSVDISAGGSIVGSNVAAVGSSPESESNVTLVAGGAITLDNATSALNEGSRAQDDLIAQAGGALTIVGASAGRDLIFTAGAGTLSAASVSAGRDLSLTGPAVQLASGSVARNLTVVATTGDITGSGTTTAGGTIDLDAQGNIAIGSLAANGGDVAADAGGSIGFADLYASGAITLSAGEAITGSSLEATNGVSAFGTRIDVGDVSAGEGDVALEASEGSLAADSVTGASVNARASGALSLGTVDAGSFAIIVGATIDFDSVSAGSSVSVDSLGTVAGGAVSAGDFASIFGRGAITLTGLTAADAFVESEGGPVSASGIAVSGAMFATGTSVDLSATGALALGAEATAGSLAVTTTGDLTVEAMATGDVALTSTTGSVTISTVRQQGGASTGTGTEAISGGGSVSVNAATGIAVLESLTAGGALTMTAGGLVSLTGSASGQTISLQAGDLAIGSGATLGGASTQRIALASRSAVNLGAGASGGFSVDAAEFARIQSTGDLMITALAGEGGGSGALTVGSLTVNAGSGGQIGTAGTFGLTAGGLLDVNSVLAIARAGSGNTLMLTGDVVDLDYANAQLSVLDSASATAGRIAVAGRLITSMSASAATDIVGRTPDQMNTRLGQADTVRETGLFRTGALALDARDAILIQNSGGSAFDDRRGFNVGALTITGAQNGGTLVVINGIIGTATGIAAAQTVTVNGTIAAGSTVNGCVLANLTSCLVIPEPEAPLIRAPESVLFGTGDFIRDEEEDDEVEDGVADGKPEAPPIDTTKIDDPAGLPMIDDPVTGAGNEDLWQPPQG